MQVGWAHAPCPSLGWHGTPLLLQPSQLPLESWKCPSWQANLKPDEQEFKLQIHRKVLCSVTLSKSLYLVLREMPAFKLNVLEMKKSQDGIQQTLNKERFPSPARHNHPFHQTLHSTLMRCLLCICTESEWHWVSPRSNQKGKREECAVAGGGEP